MGDERGLTLEETPAVEPETYPADYCASAVEQWLTWKPTDDGRKIPRAPYANPAHPDRYVSAQNPDVWTTFETAHDWAEKLPGHQLAFTIRDREEYPDEDLVLTPCEESQDDGPGLWTTVRQWFTE